VLDAAGIACGIAMARGQHVLLVRAEDADRAVIELFRYVRENREPESDEEPQLPLAWSVGAAAAYPVLLFAFDIAQARELFGLPWMESGLADAAAIRDGAWWRCVTALCLHADFLHLAGNLVFGAAFGIMLAQSLGIGLAWLTFLVTGLVANGMNAWLQSPSHASIGASTAIFGMLGAQAAHDWVRRRRIHYNPFRRWAPIAIGAALLAWLGGDGRPVDPSAVTNTLPDLNVPLPRIDVWAHVLGFAVGIGVGALVGWRKANFRLTPRAQAAIAAAVWICLGLAWYLALR
jgi:rhomboid protease GluP